MIIFVTINPIGAKKIEEIKISGIMLVNGLGFECKSPSRFPFSSSIKILFDKLKERKISQEPILRFFFFFNL